MLQSCLRPTIPSVKLPPSKLFRILLGKLPTLEARFPLLPLPRPLIPPGGGMSSDLFSRIPAAIQAYLH